MKRAIVFPVLCLMLILGSALYFLDLKRVRAASLAAVKTLVLYDAASGVVPGAPLMSFTDFPPGTALQAYSDGVTILDTTAVGNDTLAGWVSTGAATPGFPILNRTAGFQVDFTIQVEAESHTSNHRAGFSVIILSDDARGIELAFWENEIWAQGDDSTGGLFRHGEGIAFATTASLTDYQVTIAGDSYTLIANNNAILTGPVRDYTTFDGFPDPYETPNFLFLGDDTRSAQARVRLSFVSVRGIEAMAPAGTSTIPSTSSPLATPSFTALPGATPVSSPTPTGRAFELCPSGWIFLAVMTPAVMMTRKIRASQ